MDKARLDVAVLNDVLGQRRRRVQSPELTRSVADGIRQNPGKMGSVGSRFLPRRRGRR